MTWGAAATPADRSARLKALRSTLPNAARTSDVPVRLGTMPPRMCFTYVRTPFGRLPCVTYTANPPCGPRLPGGRFLCLAPTITAPGGQGP